MASPSSPSSSGSALKYPCDLCPIRGLKIFRPFSAEELRFVNSFKAGELVVDPRATILQEGTSSTHLFTVLIGWCFRYKMLPDGRRQILNFGLPGDFLGLQASMFNEMTHSVEALTSMTLCVFPRERIWELYENYASLSFDLTWLAAREEQILDGNLLNVGRRNAIERTAYLILHLFTRARDVGLGSRNSLTLPVTQQHVADTLGMSIVHTNKTLRRLFDRKLVAWKSQRLEILNMDGLKEVAQWDGDAAGQLRPLI